MPVYNEAAQLAERITALRTFLDQSFPFRALVTIVDNASTDDTYAIANHLAATTRGVAAMHLDRKGRGYALRAAWSTQRGAGRGLHGRRPLDLVAGAAAVGGPAAVRPSRRHHRLAAGAGRARGARAQARAHFAGVQPAAQAHAAGPLQRCPVRVQGPAPRRGGEAAAAHRGQRVVLRHRAARHGRAPGPAHRRGPGGLGRRPRLAGADRLDRQRRPARRLADAGPAPQGPAPRPVERGDGRPAHALRRGGRRLHARLPLPLHRLAAAARRLRRQRGRHGHRHALQHGRAPGALPHHRRSGPPRPPLRRGRRAVPGEPRPHDAGARRGPVGGPVAPCSPSWSPSPSPT